MVKKTLVIGGTHVTHTTEEQTICCRQGQTVQRHNRAEVGQSKNSLYTAIQQGE